MSDHAHGNAEFLLISTDDGVVVLPPDAVEPARAMASGHAANREELRAAGGLVIDGPGPWVVSASAGAVRLDALPEPEPEPEIDQPAPEPEQAPEPELEPEPAPIPDVDPDATVVDESDSRFGALFGATIAGRRIEDAAVREAQVEPPPPPAASPMVPPPPPAPVHHESAATNVSAPPPVAPPAAPVQPTEPAPAEPKLVDPLHDGQTMTPEQFAALRAARSGGAAPSPAAAVQPRRPRVTLRVSTGETVGLDSPVVFGRRPQPRSIGSDVSPQLVVIDNPYVSGTHLEVRFDRRVVVATDFSSNGTLLTKPGFATHALVPNQPTALVDGATLHLTDGLTVDVSIDAV